MDTVDIRLGEPNYYNTVEWSSCIFVAQGFDQWAGSGEVNDAIIIVLVATGATSLRNTAGLKVH